MLKVAFTIGILMITLLPVSGSAYLHEHHMILNEKGVACSTLDHY